jgi:hypothetical protein
MRSATTVPSSSTIRYDIRGTASSKSLSDAHDERATPFTSRCRCRPIHFATQSSHLGLPPQYGLKPSPLELEAESFLFGLFLDITAVKVDVLAFQVGMDSDSDLMELIDGLF